MFGLSNGVSVSLVVVAIILFSYNSISIDTNETFKRDFPMWRGVSYIIMYMWVMAFNTVIFEKYKVNYQLILNFSKLSSTSAFILSYASVFTLIFMLVFLIYVMDIAGIVSVG